MRRTLIASGLAVLAGISALAQGFGNDQHGGRGTSEVGALTARADDPTAVSVNPAGIARSKAFQLQLGADFGLSVDRYESTSGSFQADHTIGLEPAFYATWELSGPLVIGVALDSPWRHVTDWNNALFPHRFESRLEHVDLKMLHAVIAASAGDHWSFGGGPAYVRGTLENGDNALIDAPGSGGPLVVEIGREAKATVDGLGFDAGVQGTWEHWGVGAVIRSPVDLAGSGRTSYRAFSPPDDPVLRAYLASTFASSSTSQHLHLPLELDAGFWMGRGALVWELDLTCRRWSGFEEKTSYSADPFARGTRISGSGWDDTVGARAALEAKLGGGFTVHGGVAYDPSPVPEDRFDPGFPSGDAFVTGAGFSYHVNNTTFDVGYSIRFSKDVTVAEPGAPPTRGTFSSDEQVWAASARFRL
ncbi:MAG: outer membrane protein transport protein [Acidobacteriota bacterium]